MSNLSAVVRMPFGTPCIYVVHEDWYDLKELGGVWSIIGQYGDKELLAELKIQ